jgi:hypothetical protein
MENVGIFYGHYIGIGIFRPKWYILWSFGNLVVIWLIFPRFGIFYPEKSGNPALDQKWLFSSKPM